MIGRLLRTGIYLLAEFLVVYAALTGAVFAFMYFGTDFSLTLQFAFGLFALAAIPLSAVLVGFGPHLADGFDHGDLSRGFYQPVRPLAALGAARRAAESERGSRNGIDLHFDETSAVSPLDIVDALAAELDRNGIENTRMGGLTVYDDGVTWGIEPSLSDSSLSIWVGSTNRDFRKQIVGGVQEFVLNHFGLEMAS